MPSDHFYARFSNSLGATGLRWAGKLNVPLYRLSGGRIGGKVGRAPVLLLTTTGRKSGQQRTAPVVYLADGERFVVINTNAGNAKIPAWSLNLKANPEAEVEVGPQALPGARPHRRGRGARPTSGAGTTSSTPASTTTRRKLDRDDRGLRARAALRRQVASRSICASGRRFSFFSVLFSIWRIRSRVTPKVRPTSSSVSGSAPERP